MDPEHFQIAIAVLMASVASVVITSVILADGARRHVISGAAGLAAGIILWLTPAGAVALRKLNEFNWIGLPVAGALFALGLSALADYLLSSKLPVFGRLRMRGRRALRAARWGTAEEIGEITNYDPGVVRALGFGVTPTPVSASRALARLRITANVVTGSCLGVFFVVPEFGHALRATFTWSHVIITLLATALGTFFLSPLHELFIHMASSGSHSEAHAEGDVASHGRTPDREGTRSLGSQLGLFALLAVPLFLLQAVHSAADHAFQKMDALQWIILLEACALPLIVTMYYFSAALHRAELGNLRWDRALGASVWFGAIVLVPFGVAVMMTSAFDSSLRETLIGAVTGVNRSSLGWILIGLLIAYAAVLIAIALAIASSWLTYGIYALALGVAMVDATPATARRRGCVAILIGGAVAQAITSGVVYWWQVDMPSLHFVHGALAIGWSLGLFLSRFDREMNAT